MTPEIDTTGYKRASDRAESVHQRKTRTDVVLRFALVWLIVLVACAILEWVILGMGGADLLHLLTVGVAAGLTVGFLFLIARRTDSETGPLTRKQWIVFTSLAIVLTPIVHIAGIIILICCVEIT